MDHSAAAPAGSPAAAQERAGLWQRGAAAGRGHGGPPRSCPEEIASISPVT